MKKIIILFTLYLAATSLFSQINDLYWKRIKSDPKNYVTIIEDYQNWLKTKYPDSIPSGALPNLKEFYRYVNYWTPRLGTDENGEFSYLNYYDVASDVYLDPICDTSDLAQWELVGPDSLPEQQLGLVDEILYNPRVSDEYLISPNHGGIWKSQSSGNSWVNKTDIMQLPGLSASEMIRNPYNTDTIYASTQYGTWGTEYGIGIIQSFDNGDTWQIMESFPDTNFPAVNKIIIDPYNSTAADSLVLYAITIDELYKSENSGDDWILINSPIIDSNLKHNSYMDLEIAYNGALFLTTQCGDTSYFFKYHNNEWEDLNENLSPFGNFVRASLTAPYGDTIFMLCDSVTADGIRKLYYSHNLGNSWTKFKDGVSSTGSGAFAARSMTEMEYSPESNLLYVSSLSMAYFKGTTPVYKYDIYQGHDDVRDIDLLGIDTIYDNGDTLIYQSFLTANDGGVTHVKYIISQWSPGIIAQWTTNLNANHLPIGNFIGFAVDNSSDEIIVGGLVHNGTQQFKNSNWSKIASNDGGDCEINWIDPNIIYYQSNASFKKKVNGISDNVYGEYDWYIGMKYELNPNDPYILYGGRVNKIIKYDERTEQAYILPTPDSLKHVGAIELNKNNTMYIADFEHIEKQSHEIAKTYDEGQTWIDLTNNYVHFQNDSLLLKNALKWKKVTEILCNPNDTNEVWISVGGIKVDTSITGNYPGMLRVIRSTDAGATWYDFSDGLTALPALDLEYQTGSNDRIFVSTDAGVYYREPGMTQWECFSEGMPIGSVKDIDYDPCSGYLYGSMDSRAIWKTPVNFIDAAIVIDTGQTLWDTRRRLTTDIKIQDGATLTITGDLYMGEDKMIIVEAGGKLIIDGAIISTTCDFMWHGIQVLGIPTMGQNGNDQGIVDIDDAVIMNSEYGVYTYKRVVNQTDGEWIYSSGHEGGIIEADGVVFKNNELAIDFYNYSSSSDSYFHTCTFVTNDDYIGTTNPSYFMKISQMSDIEINYCIFKNESSTNQLHSGIYSFNSDFDVDGYYLTSTSTWQCGEFEDLDYGIYALSSSSSKYIDVQHTAFDQCFRGIYISGMSNPRITENEFEINELFATNGGCGLYLNACSGYHVEANEFEHTGLGQYGLGILVNNSGTASNEIYRNYFTNLEQGISAQLINKHSLSNTQGLQILCNDFDDCEADILVPDMETIGSGIAGRQGVDGTDAEDMAGNMFYIEDDRPDGDYDDLNNEETYFKYYYPSNPATGYDVTDPIDYTTSTIDKYGKSIGSAWEFDNGCPSELTTGGGVKSSGEFTDYNEMLVFYTQQVNEVEAILDEIVDGGDTEGLNADVEMSTPPETMAIYNELMNESPDLSEKVVETSIDKDDVLLNSMVRDIMVANPHSAGIDILVEKLDERSVPLPEYMKAQILEARSNTSLKDQVESELAGYKIRQARALNGLARQYLSDTENPEIAMESLTQLYQGFDDINIKYRLAILLLSNGDYTLSNNILSEIPNQFSLNMEELLAHNNMVNFYNIIKAVKQDGRNETQVTSIEIQEIAEIYEAGHGLSSTYAQNILLDVGFIEYLAPIKLPDINKSNKLEQEYEELLKTKVPSQLSVFPNPSKDFVIVEYAQELQNEGLVEIQDVNGKLIKNILINRLKDQVTVPTQNWKPGLYIATLIIKGKTIESVKFTLVE